MGGIIDSSSGKGTKPGAMPQGLVVKGVPYANSAAKFWASLANEIANDFPECDGVRMTGVGGGMLAPALLNPERILQANLDSLNEEEMEESFRQALAELELVGPPPLVEITLLSEGREVMRRQMPADCMDAELLPYLLVWLVEWAQISEFLWNADRTSGDFEAEDIEGRYRYQVRFALENRHLSEGLFDRRVTTRFRRENIVAGRRRGAAVPEDAPTAR